MYVCDDFFLNSPKIVMYTLFNGLILITSVTAGRGGFILFWKKITKQTKYNYTLILVIIKLFTIKNGGEKGRKTIYDLRWSNKSNTPDIHMSYGKSICSITRGYRVSPQILSVVSRVLKEMV